MIPIKIIALQRFEGRFTQMNDKYFQAQNWIKSMKMVKTLNRKLSLGIQEIL
jgi:hypothetical protein